MQIIKINTIIVFKYAFKKSYYFSKIDYIWKLIDLNKEKIPNYSIKSILNKIMKQNKIFLIIYL